MIFWWSESRLAKFIENCIKQGYFQQEIETLSGEIDLINNSVDNNKSNIKGLGKIINEYRQETSDAIDVMNRSIASIQNAEIKSDYIQYVNKAIFENNVAQTEIWQQSLNTNNMLSEADVKAIVKKYIQSIGIQNQPFVKKEIISELTQYINGVITQNNSKINKTLMNYESELKCLSTEIERQSSTDLLATVVKGYEDEKKKTAELSEIVRKQADEIALLSGTIEELKVQIGTLKAKLDSNSVDIPVLSPRKTLLFDDNNNENRCKLLTLLNQANILKNKLCKMGVDSADVYLKLVENLIDKLDKLILKNAEKRYTADKLANETVKILRQTIIKGMTQEKVKEVFKEYMDECAIRRLEWSIGRKMSNDDYEYLEEPIMYEEVIDDNKVGTILAIIQDTYVIDYFEDDERYEAIIPGLYRIGKKH